MGRRPPKRREDRLQILRRYAGAVVGDGEFVAEFVRRTSILMTPVAAGAYFTALERTL